MLVAEAVGRALAGLGVDAAFGLLGSGNLTVTNALRDAGARFVAARHENGAVCMADGYARVSGRLAACPVHQGPGLTNAVTGLTEAAKSRTPLLLLAADTPAAALRSNFRIDQAGLVEAVGAAAERVHRPDTAMDDVGPDLRRLGELTGAVLATSAVANGLFAGDPYDLGIAGGFSAPLAARLLREADAVIAFGAALNPWTTRHGTLLGREARVAQVDLDEEAIGAHRPVDVGVVGDAAATAAALVAALEGRAAAGYRTPGLAEDIRVYRWRNERYEESTAALDPRTFSIAL